MIKRSEVLVLAALALGACSSGSDSPSSGGSSIDGSDPSPSSDDSPSRGSDVEPGSIGEDAPSDEELAAAQGVVTVEQALALVPGQWVHTTSDTQCAQTVTFTNERRFTQTELDKVAGGVYRVDDIDGGTELVYDYTEDNGRVDCFGNNEQLVEDGATFTNFITFPDRNTMTFSSSPNGAGFSRDFIRQ